MTVTKPLGIVLQLIAAVLLISGLFAIWSGDDPASSTPKIAIGVVLLLIGRRTKKA